VRLWSFLVALARIPVLAKTCRVYAIDLLALGLGQTYSWSVETNRFSTRLKPGTANCRFCREVVGEPVFSRQLDWLYSGDAGSGIFTGYSFGVL